MLKFNLRPIWWIVLVSHCGNIEGLGGWEPLLGTLLLKGARRREPSEPEDAWSETIILFKWTPESSVEAYVLFRPCLRAHSPLLSRLRESHACVYRGCEDVTRFFKQPLLWILVWRLWQPPKGGFSTRYIQNICAAILNTQIYIRTKSSLEMFISSQMLSRGAVI